MFSRKLVSAFVIAVLVAIASTSVASTDDSSSEANPRAVGVTIDSRPDHAEVEIDGKFVGTTPLPYRLTPGEHKITLSRMHYSNWSRELTVTPEISTRVTAILDEAEKKPCK